MQLIAVPMHHAGTGDYPLLSPYAVNNPSRFATDIVSRTAFQFYTLSRTRRPVYFYAKTEVVDDYFAAITPLNCLFHTLCFSPMLIKFASAE